MGDNENNGKLGVAQRTAKTVGNLINPMEREREWKYLLENRLRKLPLSGKIFTISFSAYFLAAYLRARQQ